MEWIKSNYTRKEINRAGDVLINSGSSRSDISYATNVLDNWRSSHSFPLQTFRIRLKRVANQIDGNALVVQRLKRAPAIIKKLKRRYSNGRATMKLFQIQDIGGCRAVLKNVNLVKKLCNTYYHIDADTRGSRCDIKHVLTNKKNYIDEPKDDGYRGIHLVYKYHSDGKRQDYNGLLIEVQIRSNLQHLWATAVETVGHFTGQAIKSNEGEKYWLDFFRLISSVFANLEKSPIVPGTPFDEKELYLQVKELSDSLQAVQKIKGWTKSLKMITSQPQDQQHKAQYYVMELDMSTRELRVYVFGKREEEKANKFYSEKEREASDNNLNKDIVLVEADTAKELQKAYPNYYLDMNDFVGILEHYLMNNGSK